MLFRIFEIWKFRKTSKIVQHFCFFFKILTLKTIFSFKKNALYVREQWLINMCKNFKSISSKMAEIRHKRRKKRHFSRHFGTLLWFPEFYFVTDFDASKSVLRSFVAFFANIWPKSMHRSSKSRIYLFDLFTWWSEMTLTCIMVTKHRKWYLQMSVILSMPIHWLCSRLKSK